MLLSASATLTQRKLKTLYILCPRARWSDGVGCLFCAWRCSSVALSALFAALLSAFLRSCHSFRSAFPLFVAFLSRRLAPVNALLTLYVCHCYGLRYLDIERPCSSAAIAVAVPWQISRLQWRKQWLGNGRTFVSSNGGSIGLAMAEASSLAMTERRQKPCLSSDGLAQLALGYR